MRLNQPIMTTTHEVEKLQRSSFFKGLVFGLLLAGAVLLLVLKHVKGEV